MNGFWSNVVPSIATSFLSYQARLISSFWRISFLILVRNKQVFPACLFSSMSASFGLRKYRFGARSVLLAAFCAASYLSDTPYFINFFSKEISYLPLLFFIFFKSLAIFCHSSVNIFLSLHVIPACQLRFELHLLYFFSMFIYGNFLNVQGFILVFELKVEC